MTLWAFFDRSERANTEFEVQKFLFFTPTSSCLAIHRPVRKEEDFVRVLPKRKEIIRSVGLVSCKINSLEASKLDSKCVLVKAVWQMRIQRGTREAVDRQNSMTYILSAVGDSFQIVFQVDHQDLMKKVRDLGLES